MDLTILFAVAALFVIIACGLYILSWVSKALLTLWQGFCALANAADRLFCRWTGERPFEAERRAAMLREEAERYAVHVPASKADEAELNSDTEHA